MDFNINSDTGGVPLDAYNLFGDQKFNPVIVIIILIIIIMFYLLFGSLGPIQETISPGQDYNSLEILLWSVFVLLILLNGVQYFYNVNIITSLKNLFTDKPEIDLRVEMPVGSNIDGDDDGDDGDDGDDDKDTEDEITGKGFIKQVFHIPNNTYTYENSKALCKAYGGRLASYDELEKSYDKGADWCSYGWSKNQMALFPTQKDKWKKLQKIEGHKNDCGRPGINGGYIDNPNVRFGVNCFGYKPNINTKESQLMSEDNIYPKDKKQVLFEKRVDEWKKKIPDILVSPFNNDNWSTY